MSNKTSDKNVGSIEDDIKLVKRYLENSAYKETDSDFFKNGGWEMVDLEIPKAMANILAEREQDKKRIQELEADLYSANCTISDYVDSIPKQKVKDKIGVLEVEEKYDYLDNKKAIQTLEELLEEK